MSPPNGTFARHVRDAAARFVARRFVPVPVRFGTKKPNLIAGWERLRLEPAGPADVRFDLDTHFPPTEERNIGLVLGAASAGLVDVDLDCPEARVAAGVLMPATGMAWGRRSAPDSHLGYVVDRPPAKAKDEYADPADPKRGKHGGLLLELRSTGGQTVVPPSRYAADAEGGTPEEPAVWSRDGDPARIDLDDLFRAVRKTAAAALLARHWPTGNRHDAALAVSGGLLRAGWAAEDVTLFLTAVVRAADDDEVEDRLRAVEDTANALSKGKPATGWPKLAHRLGGHGPAIVARVRDWLGIRSDERPNPAGGSGRGQGRVSEVSDVGRGRLREVPPWVPFPVDTLPPLISRLVEGVSAAVGCDPVYVAAPTLALLGAAVGGSHVVSPKAGWKVPPFVWSVSVGKSGTQKTPGFEVAEAVAEDLNDVLECEYESALAEYTRACEAISEQEGEAERPERPVKRSFSKSDVTIEALVGTLQDNPRGILVANDELDEWLKSFTKYAGKAGSSDLPKWLKLFSGGTINYTRKTGDRREVRVRGVGLAVCGTIQPGVMARAMTDEFRESGFLARMLVAYPPRRPRVWNEHEPPADVRDEVAALVNELFRTELERWPNGRIRPYLVRLTPAAKAAFVGFYNANGEDMAVATDDVAAAFSKLEQYALRFALIFHCCRHRGAARHLPVSPEDMTAAIRLTAWFKRETERVYVLLGEKEDTRHTRDLFESVVRVAERVSRKRDDGFFGLTVRDLQNSNRNRYPDRVAAQAALESLVTGGLGEWVDRDAAGLGGRRVRFFVPAPPPTSDTSDTSPADGDGRPPGPTSDTSRESGPDGPAGKSEPSGVNTVPAEPSDEIPSPLPGEVSEVSDVGAGCDGLWNPSGSGPAPSARNRDRVGEVSEAGFRRIATVEGVNHLAADIAGRGGPVALDTETTGLDPGRDRVRLIQVGVAGAVAVIDVFALPDPRADLARLFAALAGVEVVGHNLTAFDLPFLARLGFTPATVFDTAVASRVVYAGKNLPHTLGDVLRRELNVAVDKSAQTSDWSRRDLTPAQLAYAAADVAHLIPLAAALRGRAAAAGLAPVLDLEMAAAVPLAALAARGVGFDAPAWLALTADAKAARDRLVEELDRLAPNPATLTGTRNWNKPAEVLAAFRQVRVELPDSSEGTLAAVDHPLAAAVLAYREAAQRVQAFGRKWAQAHDRGGRVFATWNPTGAKTGRMSCAGPNLQQVPRAAGYRKCFVAAPGHVLVKCDFSQIELRIAAKVTGDAAMTAAYRDGLDLHRMTAAAFLGVDETDVTQDARSAAKIVNFGAIYGMSPKGLRRKARTAYGRDISVDDARRFLAAFFARFPAVARWHARLKRSNATRVTTLAGRAIAVAADQFYGAKANFVVQGTGGDGLKRALVLLHERRADCPNARPVLAVHDEVVVEVPEAEAGSAKEWLSRCMVDGMRTLIDPVPVEVEASVGRTWGG